MFVAAQQPEGRCVWGMRLRSRSCRNPLKMKNAHLEALGNSQNNPGTGWNSAVQLPLVNSTILEGCEISRGIFRPLYGINSVQNFLVRKNPSAKSLPPCSFWWALDLGIWTQSARFAKQEEKLKRRCGMVTPGVLSDVECLMCASRDAAEWQEHTAPRYLRALHALGLARRDAAGPQAGWSPTPTRKPSTRLIHSSPFLIRGGTAQARGS